MRRLEDNAWATSIFVSSWHIPAAGLVGLISTHLSLSPLFSSCKHAHVELFEVQLSKGLVCSMELIAC